MNLSVTGISHTCTAFVCAVSRSDIATLCICREEEDVAITTRSEDDRITGMTRNLPSRHVPNNDPLSMTIYFNQVEHLVAIEHLHLA